MSLIDILVIDDSDAFIKLTRRSLGKAGVECNIADVSNGRRALDYLAETTKCPDVILLDMNMPVMDGFDFLNEYTKSHKCLNKSLVYMLTSSIMDKDKSRAQEYPLLKAYFEKPLTPDNIVHILADVKASMG
ncbi:MAG: two-component system response regulator [Bacteroidetes bacterium]|nr:two-component system response regulator [Bacteroidota bacterium]